MRSEKVRRTLDRLAYTSLFLDVCIAVVTLYATLAEESPGRLLAPVSYVLTAVVVLSMALLLVLIGLKVKEREA